MDLNKLKIFMHVAELGGVSAATGELKMSQAAISTAISALESELGCKLFARHYRGLNLTSKGENLYAHSKKIFREVNSALNSISDKEEKIKGSLRIATSYGIAASNWFTNKIHTITTQYPDLNLKIIDYKEGDIDAVNADVFICPHVYNRLDLIQEEIRSVQFKIFASQDYLSKHGTPTKPEDLDHHRLLAFSKELKNPFTNVDALLHTKRELKKPRKVFLEVNNTISLLKLIVKGTGMGVLSVEAGKEYDLVPILESEIGTFKEICLIYHKRDKEKPLIKSFCQYFTK